MGEEEEEEEMRMRRRDYGSSNDDEEEIIERVLEWEEGLPSADELTPLSQHLIPPELASAFSIQAEPLSTMLDVNRATHKTLSTLFPSSISISSSRRRRHHHHHHRAKINNLITKPFSSSTLNEEDVNQSHEEEDPMVVQEHDDDDGEDPPGTPNPIDGSGTRKIRRRRRRVHTTNTEEADSGFRTVNSNDDHSARTLKRPRLVWTPQLHKRFVDVVAHLGIKNAVPKTIMQLMNVEGLTRENVASHLQKYRLYLKRMQGLSNEGPSSSDPLFASTPVPHSLHDPPTTGTTSGKQQISQTPPPPPLLPMPYGGNMLPMPVLGHGFGNPAAYQGFEFHPYGTRMFLDQQRDWSSGNRFGPMVLYPKASKR